MLFSKTTKKKPEEILTFILGFICILMVVGTGEHRYQISYWQKIANNTMYMELLFIVLYMVLLKITFPYILKQINLWSYIFGFWIVLVSFSFITSPLHLMEEQVALDRYLQTVVHAIFFIFILDFVRNHTINYKVILYAIILSSLLVIAKFFYDYYFAHWAVNIWLHAPPLNSNIRHTAFQVVSAIGFSIAFLLPDQRKKIYINSATFVLLLSFLFWMGGRGSIISVYTAFLLLIIMLFLLKKTTTQIFIFLTIATLLSIFISESLCIFDWNGLFHTVKLSVNTDSINSLSSDRIDIWINTLGVIKDNLFFGLGSQGFFINQDLFMYNIVHPHNFLLQFLVEWGLIGTIFFLALVAKGLWTGFKLHFVKSKSLNTLYLASGTVLLILLVHSFVAGIFFHPQSTVYFIIAMAIWISEIKCQNKSSYLI